MNESSTKLTVYFDDPFWVGVFERIENGELSVCKVTFGAEPKDCEVWDFVLRHYYELKFSPTLKVKTKQAARNPKRRQREAKNQLQNTGIGTKSQQALAALREETKIERRKIGKEQKEAEQQRLMEIRRQKKNIRDIKNREGKMSIPRLNAWSNKAAFSARLEIVLRKFFIEKILLAE